MQIPIRAIRWNGLGESIDEVAKEYGGQNHDQVVIKVENGTWYVNRKSAALQQEIIYFLQAHRILT